MTNQTEAAAPAVVPQLAGIGGWLVLPAIGFVLGPILGVAMLVVAFGLYPDVAAEGHGNLYALELLVEVGLLVFLIYAAARFFGQRSNAPSVIVAFMIASLVASAVLLMVELGAGAQDFAAESVKQLVRGAINAAIWIPYFKVSRRVKAAFIK